MSNFIRIFMFALVGLAAGAAPTRAAPLPSPQIFAPGVISGPANDGAPTFAPDGRTLYFERTNGRYSAILESRRAGIGWSTPRLASFSGPSSDQQPAMSPDGRRLVFVSSRIEAGSSPPRVVSHIWKVRRTKTGWAAPTELPPAVNISRRVFKPSVAANGDLYFMADLDSTPAGQNRWRIYRSKMRDGVYQTAQPLPFSDGAYPDADPAVAPDQSFIIFSSRGRRGADGLEHLFIARREGAAWGPVQPIRYEGDDAGAADDGEAQLAPDGDTFYFISGRVTPLPPPAKRTRADAAAAVKRMTGWENSNTNVWMLPLRSYVMPNASPGARA